MMIESAFDFAMLGHRCTVIGADFSEERWLRKHWEFDTKVRRPRPMRITIRFLHDPPAVAARPVGPTLVTLLHGVRLEWQEHGVRWWSTGCGDASVEFKLTMNNVAILVRRTTGSISTFPLEAALHVALSEALRTSGLTPLHAAVVARDGRATAMVGRSGIGKSTAFLMALDQGWQPVAEDLAWLDPASSWVYGWDRGLRLTTQTIAQSGPNWQTDGWRPDYDYELTPDRERSATSKTRGAELTRIALLQRDPARPSSWEKLGLPDSIRVVCESAGVPICRDNRNVFAARVPQLLARLEVTRLIVGQTPLPL